MRHLLLPSISVLFLLFQTATQTVDLLQLPARNRLREPVTGSTSGGGTGGSTEATTNKLSIKLSSILFEQQGTSGPHFTVEVEIRNDSGKAIMFPIDPSLADFESPNPSVPYSYDWAYVTLFTEFPKPGLFLRGVSLFGSRGVKGSLRELAAGESLRLRAQIPLKSAAADGLNFPASEASMSASLLMQRAYVSLRNGSLNQDTSQIMPQVMSSPAVAVAP